MLVLSLGPRPFLLRRCRSLLSCSLLGMGSCSGKQLLEASLEVPLQISSRLSAGL